ncbi:MAG: hypothetical protein JSS32_05885 [Verrucomicrobia bacterium]|nr:hypothetical protein [Verrucomicrobiota bacterium]
MKWLLFLCPCALFSSVFYFTPPPKWECAQPKNMSPHVQVGFVGKGTTEFNPSINLAFEDVDVSLKEYVKAVKQVHLSQGDTKWRDLGKFKMAAGEGRLIELSFPSAWGEVKMLQALYVHEAQACILTAAVLKKDYPEFQQPLLQSLQSLSVAADIISSLPQEGQRQMLTEFYASINGAEEKGEEWKKNQWTRLQKIIGEECKEMGGHWHFLALKEGYSKIYTPPTQ